MMYICGNKNIKNMATTAVQNPTVVEQPKMKEEIDFLFPKEGQEITIDDFKAMVKEAEKGPFQTQEEFDKDIDLWLRENIIEKI